MKFKKLLLNELTQTHPPTTTTTTTITTITTTSGLFESEQASGVFNLLLATLLLVTGVNTLSLLLQPAGLKDMLRFFGNVYGDFPKFLLLDGLMHFLVLVVFYPLLRQWTLLHAQASAGKAKLLDALFGLLATVIGLGAYSLITYLVMRYQISTLIAFYTLVDKVRLTMKVGAFAIENRRKFELAKSEGE